MYLNTISGLRNEVETTQRYKRISQKNYRLLFIDKCNFVVHSILQGNLHKYQSEKTEAVPLHNDILKDQLGSNYKDILNVMIDLDYIHTNGSYVVGKHARKYRLTEKALSQDIVKVGVLNKNTENRLNRYRRNALKGLLKDSNVAKIFYSITDLHFNAPEDKEKYISSLIGEQDTEQRKHYLDWFDKLTTYNNFTTAQEYMESDFYIMKCRKTGRIYNTYTHIPKEFRKLLTTKSGDKLTELDFKNSQFLILAFMFNLATSEGLANINNLYVNPILNNNKEVIENNLYNNNNSVYVLQDVCKIESKQLINDIIQGDFYLNFINKKNELGFQKYIPTDNRKEIKKHALKSLYSYVNKELTKEELVLQSMYPNFFKWIRYNKIQLNSLSNNKAFAGHKLFAHLVQNVESDIFIKSFFSKLPLNAFAFPIHDSITCKVKQKESIKELMVKCIEEKFKQVKINPKTISEKLIKESC